LPPPTNKIATSIENTLLISSFHCLNNIFEGTIIIGTSCLFIIDSLIAHIAVKVLPEPVHISKIPRLLLVSQLFNIAS